MNADGSGEEQLTDLEGYNSNAPAWSPNGRKIAFHSNRGGGVGESDIYVMNADGSEQTRLTNLTALGLGGAHFASWSPDGEKVVFNSFFNADSSRGDLRRQRRRDRADQPDQSRERRRPPGLVWTAP
jgi:TolB protein